MKLKSTALSICFVAATSTAAFAQSGFVDNHDRTLRCDDSNQDSSRIEHCEVREQTLASTASLRVEPGTNGGVSVKGWSQPGVLVRSKVQAWGSSLPDAQAFFSGVHVSAVPGEVKTSGPQTEGERGWSVSYEVFVPHNTSLEIETTNGGLHIADVEGTMNLHAQNGGLHLTRLGGDVTAVTVNGGVHVDLMGDHWEGKGLEVTSTNGGVHVGVPQTYSAQFEGHTVNGGISSDIAELPVTHDRSQPRPQAISGAVGRGGASIHATTTNGGIAFVRQ